MDQPAFDRMSAELQSALLDVLPHLRAFARSLTRNRDQADDLVNDAIVRAISASRQFTPGTNFKAWIFTILRNLFYNEGRKRHNRFSSLDDLTVNEPSINASQEASLEFCDFRRAFWQLNPDQREVLILVGASGLSYDEAAEVCGCRVGTIKSRVSRARADLKRMLDDDTLATIRTDSAPVSSGGLGDALEHRKSERPALRRARQ
ncbi:MAG: sigma-70 family RNA polymerase sigma factor [Dongiaceae bacterium]